MSASSNKVRRWSTRLVSICTTGIRQPAVDKSKASSVYMTHCSSITNSIHRTKRGTLHPQMVVDLDSLLVVLIRQDLGKSADERVHGCVNTDKTLSRKGWHP
jgi:hypothetical protein